ncbi:MAG TPA: J domain-containing protein [Thermomicrobiales bacterium]|nr:J domain-containing protein [Thermomicrobiales bacterium]
MIFLGAKDYIDQRGFLIHECPTCHEERTFAVYNTRRKLTLYLIPTVGVRSQHVMECMTCHGKWGISDAQWGDVEPALMTQEQLASWIRQQGQGRGRGIPGAVPRLQPTLYQVLQVDPSADPEIIDAAYRRLAMRYHPDRGGGTEAQERMRQLNTARDILRDPRKRAAYDRTLGIVRLPEAMRPEDV